MMKGKGIKDNRPILKKYTIKIYKKGEPLFTTDKVDVKIN
jgi:hypothetical protein